MRAAWEWLKADRVRWGVFVLSLVLFLMWLTRVLSLDMFETW